MSLNRRLTILEHYQVGYTTAAEKQAAEGRVLASLLLWKAHLGHVAERHPQNFQETGCVACGEYLALAHQSPRQMAQDRARGLLGPAAGDREWLLEKVASLAARQHFSPVGGGR